MQDLQSYTEYLFIAYALNELGRSPPSTPLDVQTSESGTFLERLKHQILIVSSDLVPLVSITDLTGSLFTNNSIRLNWTVDHQNLDLLYGKFRTFTVIIYRNFSKLISIKIFTIQSSDFFPTDMSTLINVETTESFLLLDHIHLDSIYFVSVAICNYHDCGPPSSIVRIDTSNSGKHIDTEKLNVMIQNFLQNNIDSRLLMETMHPIHQPLLLNCHVSSATWFHQ